MNFANRTIKVSPRGTPQFKTSICEENFDYDLRFKEYDVYFDNNETAVINWVTQGDCSDHDDFDEELKRYFEHIGFNGIVFVTLQDRDGIDEFNYTLEI